MGFVATGPGLSAPSVSLQRVTAQPAGCGDAAQASVSLREVCVVLTACLPAGGAPPAGGCSSVVARTCAVRARGPYRLHRIESDCCLGAGLAATGEGRLMDRLHLGGMHTPHGPLPALALCPRPEKMAIELARFRGSSVGNCRLHASFANS